MYPGKTLLRPHITEKSQMRSEDTAHPVYTFEVAMDANKHDVLAAIRLLYKVTPVKVGMIRIPAKRVMRRGKPGRQPGYKKAMVYLKAGDKITF